MGLGTKMSKNPSGSGNAPPDAGTIKDAPKSGLRTLGEGVVIAGLANMTSATVEEKIY